MKKVLVLSLVVLFAMSLTSVAFAKKSTTDRYRLADPKYIGDGDPSVIVNDGPSLSSSAIDTFHIAWYGFQNNDGTANEMGWVRTDLNDQLDDFFHVASVVELDGGVGVILPWKTHAFFEPLNGLRSMWCGVDTPVSQGGVAQEVPFCGWEILPGNGNQWDQLMVSKELVADSVELSYLVWWDAEPGYDWTLLEWSTDSIEWFEASVGDTFSQTTGKYDGHGPYPGDGGHNSLLTEIFGGAGMLQPGFGPTLGATATAGHTGSWWLRFHHISDTAWSSEDGLWPIDGPIILDDITVALKQSDGTPISSTTSTFEGLVDGTHADEHGIWLGQGSPGFAHFHNLYKGTEVLQRDNCFSVFDQLWGFFDEVTITDYSCGGFPLEPAMPYKNIRNQYMLNEVWSPLVPLGNNPGDLWLFNYLAYEDLPLDNLQFHVWHVRVYDATGCPSLWGDNFNVYSDPGHQWFRYSWEVAPFLDEIANPTHIQLAVGAWDYCGAVCGNFGTGSCHSNAPLLDEVHLMQVNVGGPQYAARHFYHLFNDAFATDGTTTGHARADIALDAQTNTNPAILPGDSVVVTVGGIITDPVTGFGPAVYAYVSVWPPNQAGKTGSDLQAPETRVGTRFPYLASNDIVHDGTTWYCFRMDSTFNQAGGLGKDKYCLDLNDWVFTPGDTICYIIAATGNGTTYMSRFGNGSRGWLTTTDLWEALSSPMEFTILPATGWKNGGDILFVDGGDGGLTQLMFDTAFELLGIDHTVDRYDIIRHGDHSLGQAVKNIQTQLIDCYRKILWNSSSNGVIPISDGTLNAKSEDFLTLSTFLANHTDNPGIYLAGNNLAEVWEIDFTGISADDFRDTYMNYTLDARSHQDDGNEVVNPLLTGVGDCFVHSGVPDKMIAYGGCPRTSRFDLFNQTGASEVAWHNADTGKIYALQQETTTASSTARVLLSGFGYNFIADDETGFPIDRVEHLRDILIWLNNVVPLPTAIPEAHFSNYLKGAYPNPFNPTTTIEYSIRDQGAVSLKVYNAAGQLVRTLVNDVQTPRTEGFRVTWDGKSNAGSSVSSGVYFYKLSAKNFAETKKMVLLK